MVLGADCSGDIGAQLLLQIILPRRGADDADMRQPIANNRQDLLGVAHLGGHRQVAALMLLRNLLVWHQWPALEVSSGRCSDAEHDGVIRVGMPDAFLVLDGGLYVGGLFEGGVADVHSLQFSDAEGLVFALVHRRQIPDALDVQQAVGRNGFIALGLAFMVQFKADHPAVNDGLLQLLEDVFGVGQVFEMVALDQPDGLQALIEDVPQEIC